MIEESPEGTLDAHHEFEEQVAAVEGGSTVAAVGLEIDGILRGWG